MLRVTLRGLQGHLVRLLLTAAAVMLGVSFVAGTFVLRDSIDDTLGGLLSKATAGVDVTVRGVETTSDGKGTGDRPGVPLALSDELSRVPGVARVSPDLQGTAFIAGKDGTAVRTGGAPSFGFAYAADDPAFSLVKGRGPASPGEVAVESATLTKSGLHVGDRTKAVIGGRTSDVLITGEVHFGSLFGATAILVDPATARTVYAIDGNVLAISITKANDTTQDELRAAVGKVLPSSVEAITGEQLRADTETEVQKGLGFFTTLLLAFAGIALFVGSFIIVNTFSMLIAQRARELALLRALGASRRQVLTTVLSEAAIVGVVGSAFGIVLGVLVALGAKTVIQNLLGADIGSSLPVTASTVLICLAVGTLVTVAAAVLPALRASRTAPVTALRGDTPIAPQGLRRRATVGISMLAAGSGLLAYTVTRPDPPWPVAGVGAAIAVLGMLVAAPAATRPVVRIIAWPFVALVGAVGTLARQNALRVPRRTAATASALMIGLALVAGISVLAESVGASVNKGVSDELTSDLVLNGGTAPVPSSLAAGVRKLPGVSSVAAISQVPVRIGGFSTDATAGTGTDIAANFKVAMHTGALGSLGGDRVLVDRTTADQYSWHVGDVVEATVGILENRALTVGGIFDDSQAFGSHLIVDRSLYRAAVPAIQQFDLRVFVRAADGADRSVLRSEIVDLVRPYLVVSVQDASEFADAQASSIDVVLNLLYVLLLFSVVIAVLGIVNTLALSVLERTREIGLLRAIGLMRAQLAGMITIEAIATAVFGAILGTGLGLGLGVALQRGLQSQGLNTLGIPWGLVVGMLGASLLVGVLAAVAPSIRAMRLTVLGAIAGV